jgi:hypothetical protein
MLPLSRYICCCCSDQWREKHLRNDWLGGSWFFLWACQFGTFVTFIIFIATLLEQNTLLIFVFGTSLIESVAFMIGSAYFVAGSYPEKHSEDHDTSHSSDINDAENPAHRSHEMRSQNISNDNTNNSNNNNNNNNNNNKNNNNSRSHSNNNNNNNNNSHNGSFTSIDINDPTTK